MTSSSIQKEIMEELEKLAANEQLEVLKFTRGLSAQKPLGTPGNKLVRLVEGIEGDDLKRMSDAIEE